MSVWYAIIATPSTDVRSHCETKGASALRKQPEA